MIHRSSVGAPIALPVALPVALLGALSLAPLRAQDAHGDAGGLPDPTRLVLIDGVAATVNDTVILQSQITSVVQGDIRVREARTGTKLTEEQRAALMQAGRWQLVQRAALAQGAKTLGLVPSQRIDEIVQDMIREDERQQQRDFGSLMRWSEDWARQNLTYDSYEREQRTAKMYELTQQIAVNARLQNQLNLFITPRRMRNAWRQSQAAIASNRAVVAVVGFSGRDDKARALAEEAARVWRAEQLTGPELQARFRDRVATSQMTVLLSSSTPQRDLPKELVAFGLAGPLGNVSEPFAAETSFQVWKVMDYAGGEQKSFDDPETQVQLRRMLEAQVIDQLREDALVRCMLRTQPWMPSLDRIGMQGQPGPPAPDKAAQQPAR
jgi:hypothetical protein